MVAPVKSSDSDGPDWELPRGRHGLPPQVVGDHQRERLLAAVAETLAEHGYAGLTVERVLAIAGVSRATFYVNFADKEEAVETTMEVAFERFLGLLLRACGAQEEWPLKVKVAIGATLDYAAAAPAQAALLDLGALTANRRIARLATDAKDHLAALLSAGRRYSERGAALPTLTEQAIVAALASAVSTRLTGGEAKRLPELAPQLVQFALLPYLGQAEAARVASRPRPEVGR
jgi:AcrR family transcriptional regulator